MSEDLTKKLDEAAQYAKQILLHRDAVTKMIVNPVSRELTKGNILAWFGIVFGILGILNTPYISEKLVKHLKPVVNNIFPHDGI